MSLVGVDAVLVGGVEERSDLLIRDPDPEADAETGS
jgi:hypothetical protein